MSVEIQTAVREIRETWGPVTKRDLAAEMADFYLAVSDWLEAVDERGFGEHSTTYEMDDMVRAQRIAEIYLGDG